jgi:hypothetical protein
MRTFNLSTSIAKPSRTFATLLSIALRGSLSTRLIVAGSLLALGNPLLTLLAYAMEDRSGSLPRAALIPIGGLQGLIALYAAVVFAQSLVASGRYAVSVVIRRSRGDSYSAAVLEAVGQERQKALRDVARQAADVVWEHEEESRQPVSALVVAYIEEVIATELRYRRRMRALESRLDGLLALVKR